MSYINNPNAIYARNHYQEVKEDFEFKTKHAEALKKSHKKRAEGSGFTSLENATIKTTARILNIRQQDWMALRKELKLDCHHFLGNNNPTSFVILSHDDHKALHSALGRSNDSCQCTEWLDSQNVPYVAIVDGILMEESDSRLLGKIYAKVSQYKPKKVKA